MHAECDALELKLEERKRKNKTLLRELHQLKADLVDAREADAEQQDADQAAEAACSSDGTNGTELDGASQTVRLSQSSSTSSMQLTSLPEDTLRRISSLDPSGSLQHSLVCRALRIISRQTRTTVVLRGWTDAKKLRWALTSLTDLKLVLENVTDWDQLHDYLSGYAIKALDVRLDRTSLGEKDVADLALALGWNRWDGTAYGLCVEPLSRVVDSCVALQELHLAGCNLGPTCDLGTYSSSMRLIDLDSNCLGDIGCIALCAGVPCSSGLQQLSLADNRISECGAEALSQLLVKCPQLSVLLLDSNAIGDVGCVSIAHALHNCVNLETLGLSDNGIGVTLDESASGWTSLACELRRTLSGGVHTKLASIDVVENGMNAVEYLVEVCAEFEVDIEQSESTCGDCGQCEDCQDRFF